MPSVTALVSLLRTAVPDRQRLLLVPCTSGRNRASERRSAHETQLEQAISTEKHAERTRKDRWSGTVATRNADRAASPHPVTPMHVV
jgi:hypothetical protein